MADAGTKNQGILVYIGTKASDAATDTYVQVKRCKTIGEFGSQAQVIDATALEDTAKQKLKGIPDVGDIELGGNRVYSDPGQLALRNAADDPDDDPYNIRIQMPGAGTAGANLRFTFKAIVSKFRDKTGSVDGLIEFAAMLAVSGAVTQTTY